MIRTLKVFLLAVLVMCAGLENSSFAYTTKADSLLHEVQLKFNKVKDYEAKVTIKLDVDFIKIPVKQGTIWFLQPDQIKVDTKGFSLLPKRGMNFSPSKLFNEDYTTIYVKQTTLNGNPVHVIKVIPNDEQDEIIISTLWIDGNRKVIRKLEATTRDEGTFVMDFTYAEKSDKYDLPTSIVFKFDIRKNELPIGLTGDFETTSLKENDNKTSRGEVIINYLEYIVNEGKAASVLKK